MTKFSLKINQQGFSLIELIVGLVIGLIATLIIAQTFSAFEGNKRTTTGTSEAQTNGSIGLFMIQRELQFAGYGIPAISGTLPPQTTPYGRIYANYTGQTQAQIDAAQAALVAAYDATRVVNSASVSAGTVYSALRCNPSPTLNIDLDNNPLTPNVNVDLVTPVRISEGATSDTITLQYGTTARGAVAMAVTSISGAQMLTVPNNLGCRFGDVILSMPDVNTGITACQASEVLSTNAFLDNPINSTSIQVVSNTNFGGKRFACLGRVNQVTFAVNNANELTKTLGGVTQPIIGEIVSLQAQYGISATANSEIVDPATPNSGWVNATGADWTNPTVANRNRIKAVRVAIVARNNLLERDVVSQDCSGAAVGPARVCAWGGNVDLLTSLGANWNRYRYRTYEMVVPIRNVLAASPQL